MLVLETFIPFSPSKYHIIKMDGWCSVKCTQITKVYVYTTANVGYPLTNLVISISSDGEELNENVAYPTVKFENQLN